MEPTISNPAPAPTTAQLTEFASLCDATATRNGWSGGYSETDAASLLNQIRDAGNSYLYQLFVLSVLNMNGK